MRRPGTGRRRPIPSSSTTTSSPGAATLRPGSSRSSLPERCAKHSGRCVRLRNSLVTRLPRAHYGRVGRHPEHSISRFGDSLTVETIRQTKDIAHNRRRLWSRDALSIAAAGVAITVIAVTAGTAISAQDKYTVRVPNGLAFSEFKGFEDWPTVAVSQSGDLIEVILANPVMIKAYRAGAPGNGKPFPDGSKMAKIHWNAKRSAEAPAPTIVPDTLHDIDFMVRDSKRFPDTGN